MMSRRFVIAAGASFAAAGCAKPADKPAPVKGAKLGDVTRLSDKLGDLVPGGAFVEELGSGFDWAEGPVWVKDGSYLLFSDVPGNVMHKWRDGEGVTEFLKPSGFSGTDASMLREGGSNGLAIDGQGKLVYANSGDRCLTRLDLKTKEKTVVVDRFNGKKFNSPNDLVVHSSGAIYFTDPPYGLKDTDDSKLKEIGFNGVYRLDPSGKIDVIEKGLKYPNGVALSPDEKTLYVSCSDPDNPIINAYAIGADGLPTAKRLFLDAKPLMAADKPGNPDGMTVDAAGRLFCAGPGGIMILSPEGELLGVIGAGRAIANCKFGEDGSTLFLTADDKLARIKLNTKGVGWA